MADAKERALYTQQKEEATRLYQAKQFPEALSLYTTTLARLTASPTAALMLDLHIDLESNIRACYVMLHQYAEALTHALIAYNLRPTETKLARRVAKCHLKLKQYGEACSLLQHNISAAPTSDDARALQRDLCSALCAWLYDTEFQAGNSVFTPLSHNRLTENVSRDPNLPAVLEAISHFAKAISIRSLPEDSSQRLRMDSCLSLLFGTPELPCCCLCWRHGDIRQSHLLYEGALKTTCQLLSLSSMRFLDRPLQGLQSPGSARCYMLCGACEVMLGKLESDFHKAVVLKVQQPVGKLAAQQVLKLSAIEAHETMPRFIVSLVWRILFATYARDRSRLFAEHVCGSSGRQTLMDDLRQATLNEAPLDASSTLTNPLSKFRFAIVMAPTANINIPFYARYTHSSIGSASLPCEAGVAVHFSVFHLLAIRRSALQQLNLPARVLLPDSHRPFEIHIPADADRLTGLPSWFLSFLEANAKEFDRQRRTLPESVLAGLRTKVATRGRARDPTLEAAFFEDQLVNQSAAALTYLPSWIPIDVTRKCWSLPPHHLLFPHIASWPQSYDRLQTGLVGRTYYHLCAESDQKDCSSYLLVEQMAGGVLISCSVLRWTSVENQVVEMMKGLHRNNNDKRLPPEPLLEGVAFAPPAGTGELQSLIRDALTYERCEDGKLADEMQAFWNHELSAAECAAGDGVPTPPGVDGAMMVRHNACIAAGQIAHLLNLAVDYRWPMQHAEQDEA